MSRKNIWSTLISALGFLILLGVSVFVAARSPITQGPDTNPNTPSDYSKLDTRKSAHHSPKQKSLSKAFFIGNLQATRMLKTSYENNLIQTNRVEQDNQLIRI